MFSGASSKGPADVTALGRHRGRAGEVAGSDGAWGADPSPEGVLLALLREERGRGARVLEALGVSGERLRLALAAAGASGLSPGSAEAQWERRMSLAGPRAAACERQRAGGATGGWHLSLVVGWHGLAAELLRWQGPLPAGMGGASAAAESPDA